MRDLSWLVLKTESLLVSSARRTAHLTPPGAPDARQSSRYTRLREAGTLYWECCMPHSLFGTFLAGAFLAIVPFTGGCAHHAASPKPGQFLGRRGHEIIVCGQLVHTGAPVVTWMDPGGFDAYRTERHFAPFADADFASSSQAVPAL